MSSAWDGLKNTLEVTEDTFYTKVVDRFVGKRFGV